MKTNRRGSLSIHFFENLSREEGLKHFVTTRRGGAGVSRDGNFNLSFNTGDPAPQVLENRKRLSRALNISLAGITTARQVHGNHARVLSSSDRGRGGRDDATALGASDALLTDLPGVCPMVLVADCVPILMYDRSKRAVAAVHAGWKGTLTCIAQRTVAAMQQHFGSNPSDILAGIGPSIGPCCFRVGPEVITAAQERFGKTAPWILAPASDGGHLDLWKANHEQLVRAGLPETHIETAELCTAHHRDTFFSYRAEGGRTGRFGAGIYVEKRSGPREKDRPPIAEKMGG